MCLCISCHLAILQPSGTGFIDPLGRIERNTIVLCFNDREELLGERTLTLRLYLNTPSAPLAAPLKLRQLSEGEEHLCPLQAHLRGSSPPTVLLTHGLPWTLSRYHVTSLITSHRNTPNWPSGLSSHKSETVPVSQVWVGCHTQTHVPV